MFFSINPMYYELLNIHSDIKSPVPFNHIFNCFNFISSTSSIFNNGGYLICP